jgi:hypothetical protein
LYDRCSGIDPPPASQSASLPFREAVVALVNTLHSFAAGCAGVAFAVAVVVAFAVAVFAAVAFVAFVAAV